MFSRSQSLEVKLVPSRIHFTSCLDPQASHDERVMGEFCRKVVERGEYPRLQVVEKEGQFFTLNNTRLHLFRRLEELGHCRRVKVERIPLRDIPEGIRQMMTVSQPLKYHQKRGYHPVGDDQHQVKSQCEDSSDDCTDTEDSDTDTDSDTDESDEYSSDEVSDNKEEEDESLL